MPKADVYIDPWSRVRRALITHAHSDHARWGHQHYLCVHRCKPLLMHRLGDIRLQSVDYGETISIGGVNFSFFPAGHIIGSAQIKVEYQGEIWVVSGDYKIEDDGISVPFEPIKCHTFITECTFGLPIYRWMPQVEIFQEINQWWKENRLAGKTSVIGCYTLGKAQRVLQGIDASIGPVYAHGSIFQIQQVIEQACGVPLKKYRHLVPGHKADLLDQALVLAPTAAFSTAWIKQFKGLSTASVSGWMQLRGTRRRSDSDRGFVLSDHADWEGLNKAIRETGASKIYVTHGYTEIFRRYLEDQSYEVAEVKTRYEGENSEHDTVEEIPNS